MFIAVINPFAVQEVFKLIIILWCAPHVVHGTAKGLRDYFLRFQTSCTRAQTVNTFTTKPVSGLSMGIHLKLPATQLKQLTRTQTQILLDLNAHSDSPRNMKSAIFHNNDHTNTIISDLDITPEEGRENLKHIHTTITS